VGELSAAEYWETLGILGPREDNADSVLSSEKKKNYEALVLLTHCAGNPEWAPCHFGALETPL
jgi:hypothetical protein